MTKDFKDRIWEECSTNQQIHKLSQRAKRIGLLDINSNKRGIRVREALFLTLLMQTVFDYNVSWDEEMPWFALGQLYDNLPFKHRDYMEYSRRIAQSYQYLAQTDLDMRDKRYSEIYALFRE